MPRKLNDFFDYQRERQYLSVYYIGIKILDIDLKHRLFVTNNYYNMFRRITSFLRVAVAKLVARGYKDINKIRLVYQQNTYKYKIKEINGQQVIVRVPETKTVCI